MHEIAFNLKHVLPEILANGKMYLDPGSGSFLLQILIASIAGAGIFIVTYWRKVKSFFARLFGKEQKSTSNIKSKDE
jgi:hypothetical protein